MNRVGRRARTDDQHAHRLERRCFGGHGQNSNIGLQRAPAWSLASLQKIRLVTRGFSHIRWSTDRRVRGKRVHLVSIIQIVAQDVVVYAFAMWMCFEIPT